MLFWVLLNAKYIRGSIASWIIDLEYYAIRSRLLNIWYIASNYFTHFSSRWHAVAKTYLTCIPLYVRLDIIETIFFKNCIHVINLCFPRKNQFSTVCMYEKVKINGSPRAFFGLTDNNKWPSVELMSTQQPTVERFIMVVVNT